MKKNECDRDSFCDIDESSAIINKEALAIIQSYACLGLWNICL